MEDPTRKYHRPPSQSQHLLCLFLFWFVVIPLFWTSLPFSVSVLLLLPLLILGLILIAPLPCLASYYLAANEWVKAEKNRIASNYNRVQAAPRNLDPRQVPQGMIGRLQVVWLDIVCKKNKIQVKKAWPTSAKCTPFEVNIKHVIMGCMVQVAHSDSVLSIIVAISKLLARLSNTQGVLQRLLRLQRDWVTLSLFSLLWWRGRL